MCEVDFSFQEVIGSVEKLAEKCVTRALWGPAHPTKHVSPYRLFSALACTIERLVGVRSHVSVNKPSTS
jgi:hypothetical protein